MAGNTTVSKDCRSAVDRLHEVMKQLDLAKLNLDHKERRYTIAVAFLSLWIGFAVADFVAAATVVYTVGPVTGLTPDRVFLTPDGAIFMNFTWFGLGLLISFIFALVSLGYGLVCSWSRKSARNAIRMLNTQLKDAKSAIVQGCPVELWYSGEA
jgi:hypothetical protein